MARRRLPDATLGDVISPAPDDVIVHDDLHDNRIRERAYFLYRERDDATGSADEDWFRAERELRGADAPDDLREDAR